jgi:GNAT superfamily N-acetyltransferase
VICLADCKLTRLLSETVIKPFDCGDDDLNEFLTKDSKNFLSELLAVTYLYEYGNETVSFFCVSNDKISHDEKVAHGEKVFSNSEWDKFQDDIPEGKRLRGYPAVKIGRLGVNQKYKRMGIGTDLLDRLKMSFTENNKTGCRFVTVDAYNNPDTISFYTSNGFDFLTKMDVKLKTRLMYFDLVRFAIHKNVS